MTVTLSGPLESYSYSWELVDAAKYMTVATKTLTIRINYSGQLFDYDQEKITVIFVDSTQIIDSINGYDMVDKGFDLYLKGRETSTRLGHWIGLYLFVFFY
mmetsp:Transcript_29105/g.33297  ORF Transcript_29105/g.33297 Transcript_29105/m.33297 type:complete len:101 (-) Transcript_29105:9-311(-)